MPFRHVGDVAIRCRAGDVLGHGASKFLRLIPARLIIARAGDRRHDMNSFASGGLHKGSQPAGAQNLLRFLCGIDDTLKGQFRIGIKVEDQQFGDFRFVGPASPGMDFDHRRLRQGN